MEELKTPLIQVAPSAETQVKIIDPVPEKKESKEKNNLKASIYMTISIVFYALQCIFHKMIFMETESGPFFQIIVKYIGLALISLVMTKNANTDIAKENKYIKENFISVFLRMSGGMLKIVFLVLSAREVRTSTIATGLTFVPIVTMIASYYLIHGENYTYRDVITFFVCIIASIFIIDPFHVEPTEKVSINNNSGIGLIYTLGCSLGYAVRNVYQKKISQLSLPYSIFIMSIFIILSACILAIIFEENVFNNRLVDVFYVSLVMLTDYISLYLNVLSINTGEVVIVQQIFYLNLPVTCILSMLFVGEIITLIQWCFILLLFSVNLFRGYLVYRDYQKAHENENQIIAQSDEDEKK